MKNIAIFASGTGTNAREIIKYFQDVADTSVSLVISGKTEAGVVEIAKEHNIAVMVLDRKEFKESEMLLSDLRGQNIDFIVLAGFMWLIPKFIVTAHQGCIVNIHPALLPKYGGKGMYGISVHKAVIDAGETESGITIHYVNERYDEGSIVFQAKCSVKPDDTPESLAERVRQLEHEHYPRVIKELVTGL